MLLSNKNTLPPEREARRGDVDTYIVGVQREDKVSLAMDCILQCCTNLGAGLGLAARLEIHIVCNPAEAPLILRS